MIDAYKRVQGTYSFDTRYIKLEDAGSRGHEFKLKKEWAVKAVRSQLRFLANKQYPEQASVKRRGHSQLKQL